eukprot:TRINITY_DN5041_c1_g1_i3.p3 TRINITY_DN5041_c1_g1~~TRINITY_DN5041_c1_g1_i3.p3  ORF type:complete len:116 (-),score=4.06 TRINITY_DN5041_c1_g1_i3:100-447(-)
MKDRVFKKLLQESDIALPEPSAHPTACCLWQDVPTDPAVVVSKFTRLPKGSPRRVTSHYKLASPFRYSQCRRALPKSARFKRSACTRQRACLQQQRLHNHRKGIGWRTTCIPPSP